MANISIYLLTFNCARTLIQPHNFASQIFDALPPHVGPPDILVLSLQEIAPIAYAFLGGSFLTPYFSALHKAVKLAAEDHVNIISRNLGLTAIMVFAKDPTKVSSLESAGVGVGVQELGNKGAVGIRLVYAETQLTFVAAHLAPMEDAMLRRNEDWKNIVKGLVFVGKDKVTRDEGDEDVPLLQGFRNGDGSGIGIYHPRSHTFVAGDLNYRVSENKPKDRDFEMFPQPTDEPDSPKHFLTLLKSDQLSQQLQNRNTLHGFSEAEITFPPTYKLLAAEDLDHWNWARHRWPSWCDRILYLELPVWMQQRITVHKYGVLPQLETSDHRPVVLSLSVPVGAIPEPPKGEDDIRLHPPSDIGPDWKSRRALARKKEIAVGIAAYLTLTWEGNGLLLATVIGSIGGWLIIRSLLAG
jgi:Endonuclease/Exonuclease/phosphatase family